MKKLLILDVCDTIYPVNTTMGFIDYCVQNTTWKFFSFFRKTLPVKAVNVIFYKLTNIDIIRAISIYFLKGFSQNCLDNKAVEYINTLNFINKIKVEVDKRQMDGWDIVLASASLDPIVSNICKKYRFSGYLSSELAFDSDSVCKGGIEKDLLNKKHQYIEKLISGYGYVTFITDNKGDSDCISHVDEFIAVVPQRHKLNLEFWKKLPINKMIIL